jgi:hypothetical protein
MTEQEWLQATDPQPMLEFLRGKVSERKLRLIAVSACRQLWGAKTDKAISGTLAIIEQLAEAGALQSVRGYVRVPAGEAVLDCGASDPVGPSTLWGEDSVPQQVAHSAIPSLLATFLGDLACWRIDLAHLGLLLTFLTSEGLPLIRQAVLIRDIVRGPLRPIRFHASWRTWNHGVCLRIAKAIYQDRSFNQLPILADALEEAGCSDTDILDHCRSGGEHVRGCWVIDALLGKS